MKQYLVTFVYVKGANSFTYESENINNLKETVNEELTHCEPCESVIVHEIREGVPSPAVFWKTQTVTISQLT